jgi:predicted lipid-binding transport protein (Tim44 family)
VAGLDPEMAGYFQEEINDNARNGVVNRISDVR